MRSLRISSTMVLPWRRRGVRRGAGGKQRTDENGSGVELTIPSHFLCPISLELMKDPVTLPTGITYDRSSIERWMEAGNSTCPITNQRLTDSESIPNHAVRKMIQEWSVENKSHGVERVPTPRIPITSSDVSDILSKLAMAHNDPCRCQELVAKLTNLGKESERNRRCIIQNGAGPALWSLFEQFVADRSEKVTALKEILQGIAFLLPSLNPDSSGSIAALECIVWFLDCGDLSSRRNAILVLQRLIASPGAVDGLAEIKGAEAALVKMIKEPISPTSTKAALAVIYHMITCDGNSSVSATRFTETDLVSSVLEMLIDCDRSVCEKALGVLDGICGLEEGRRLAYDHALTVPVVIKKILRVSETATVFSVSILWKLCKAEATTEGGGRAVVVEEALKVGVFQKLLLLLQVRGCGNERTKEKVKELLKMMNPQRGRMEECVDSMDFKDLKRPF
ncbi:hypothetical protein Nepgr_016982 [Nepenthes gracilis]|uniref:U-box domain-containing protein n=1 Tax=Nepenthes gracilis TaxID=150966 RepID=A0AAD3SRP9_NEPGR|nr:hypothetical protein Nepgr_016982 [Nepenthes gracilis]